MKLFDLAQLPISVPDLGLPFPKSIDLPIAGKLDLRGVDHVAEATLTRGSELLVNSTLAIALFVFGWFFAIAVMNGIQRAMLRAKVDEIVASFVASLARYLVILGVFVVILGQFNVSSTTILTIVGAIGLALTVSLKDTLSGVAAGTMLLLTRPFTVKDYIQVGDLKGSVKRITLFKTEINTADNMRVFIPNHHIWNNVLHNHTYNRTRVVEVNLKVPFTCTTQRAIELIRQLVDMDVRVLKDPSPQIGVWELTDTAMVYRIRVWTKTLQYQELRMSILQLLRDGFDREGVALQPPALSAAPAKTNPPAKKAGKRRKA